jgi:hypothetical protein
MGHSATAAMPILGWSGRAKFGGMPATQKTWYALGPGAQGCTPGNQLHSPLAGFRIVTQF